MPRLSQYRHPADKGMDASKQEDVLADIEHILNTVGLEPWTEDVLMTLAAQMKEATDTEVSD